jgi:hypothetical protein
MAWNDFLYQNTGADDFMRAARQVQGQGLNALTTGDFWQSAGMGALEGGLTAAMLFPPAGAAIGAGRAAMLGAKSLPAVARAATTTGAKTAATNAFGTFLKPVSRFSNPIVNKGLTGLKWLTTAGAAGSLLPTGAAASQPQELTMQQKTDRSRTAMRQGIQDMRKRQQEQAAADALAAEQAKLLQAQIDTAGREAYGSSLGLAQSQFTAGKKDAQRDLRNLMMQLGQQYSGRVQDTSMAAAQAGMDTSPGALDVGIDSLGEARAIGETGARTAYAGEIAKLTQQLAQQRGQAALARQKAQQDAIMQAYLAEQGLL